MRNNDIIRRLRYAFDFNDDKMIKIFKAADVDVTREQISDWLKKDDDPKVKEIYDKDLAVFLNGLINTNRGKKEGEQPKPEKSLNNNQIFRKLKIALSMQDDDIIDVLKLVDLNVSPHEISALFRNPKQSQYRVCKDQFLRNFIFGLQEKYRPNKA